jgi:hypothetical protein
MRFLLSWREIDFIAMRLNQSKEFKIMTLRETLKKLKEGVLTQLSPEDIAIMDAATEELVRSGIAKGAKKIGDQAPDLELPNASGEIVRLSDLLARGPAVLTFYRGTW